MAKVEPGMGCQAAGCLGAIAVAVVFALSALLEPLLFAGLLGCVGVTMLVAGLGLGRPAYAVAGSIYCAMSGACLLACWLLLRPPGGQRSELIDAVMVINLAGHVAIIAVLAVAAVQRAARPVVAWTCRGCGHDLFGLVEPMCPECGRLLEADQIRNAPPGMLIRGARS